MAKKRYGRWQIEKSLDEGGQGHLYLVTDTLKQKGGGLYLLKRLKDSNRLERFKQEIDVTERLKHLKVIQIEDYRLDGGKPYYVMEYCERGSLGRSVVLASKAKSTGPSRF